MEKKEYSYSREAIKNAVNAFADEVSLNGENVLTDEDFENLMQAPDIRDLINSDHIMNFEDGLAIGISVGYRMGVSHVVGIVFDLDQSSTEAGIDPDSVEIDE